MVTSSDVTVLSTMRTSDVSGSIRTRSICIFLFSTKCTILQKDLGLEQDMHIITKKSNNH